MCLEQVKHLRSDQLDGPANDLSDLVLGHAPADCEPPEAEFGVLTLRTRAFDLAGKAGDGVGVLGDAKGGFEVRNALVGEVR